MRNKKWKELKQECMEQMDFDKCYTAMTSVGWHYGPPRANGPVTRESIRETANYVLDSAIKNLKDKISGDEGFCGTGGFEAHAYKNVEGEKTLILKMVMAEWEAWGYTE